MNNWRGYKRKLIFDFLHTVLLTSYPVPQRDGFFGRYRSFRMTNIILLSLIITHSFSPYPVIPSIHSGQTLSIAKAPSFSTYKPITLSSYHPFLYLSTYHPITLSTISTLRSLTFEQSLYGALTSFRIPFKTLSTVRLLIRACGVSFKRCLNTGTNAYLTSSGITYARCSKAAIPCAIL